MSEGASTLSTKTKKPKIVTSPKKLELQLQQQQQQRQDDATIMSAASSSSSLSTRKSEGIHLRLSGGTKDVESGETGDATLKRCYDPRIIRMIFYSLKDWSDFGFRTCFASLLRTHTLIGRVYISLQDLEQEQKDANEDGIVITKSIYNLLENLPEEYKRHISEYEENFPEEIKKMQPVYETGKITCKIQFKRRNKQLKQAKKEEIRKAHKERIKAERSQAGSGKLKKLGSVKRESLCEKDYIYTEVHANFKKIKVSNAAYFDKQSNDLFVSLQIGVFNMKHTEPDKNTPGINMSKEAFLMSEDDIKEDTRYISHSKVWRVQKTFPDKLKTTVKQKVGHAATWRGVGSIMAPSDRKNGDEHDMFKRQFLCIDVWDEDITAREIEDYLKSCFNYTMKVSLMYASQSVFLNMENIPYYLLIILAFLEFGLWVVFSIYYIVTLFQRGTRDTFISDSKLRNCKLIPRTVNEKVYLSTDSTGMTSWSSMATYMANSTRYSVDLKHFEASSAVLQGFFDATESNLQTLASIGKSRNSAWQAILWSTFTDTHRPFAPNTGTYIFRLQGDPSFIFNKESIWASIGGRDFGLCSPLATVGSFDLGSKSLEMKVKDYFNATTSGDCPVIFNSTLFGFAANEVGGPYKADLNIRFDIRSVTTALAINMNQIDVNELSRVAINGENVFSLYNHCNVNDAACGGLTVVEFSGFYHSQMIGMDILNCVGMVPSDDLTSDARYYCFVRKGDMLLLPGINHYENCSCSVGGNAQSCDQQNFMTTLLYFPSESIHSFPHTMDTVGYYKGSQYNENDADILINSHIYDGAKMSIDAIKEKTNPSVSSIQTAYNQVCSDPNFPCSQISFQTFDVDLAINGFATQLNHTSCSNTFYDSSAFQAIREQHPFNMYEKFYSCSLSFEDNLINSVGISLGNAGLFTQILMFIFTLIIGQILKHRYNYTTDYASQDYADELAEKRSKMPRKKSESGWEYIRRVFSNLIRGEDVKSPYRDDDDERDADIDIQTLMLEESQRDISNLKDRKLKEVLNGFKNEVAYLSNCEKNNRAVINENKDQHRRLTKENERMKKQIKELQQKCGLEVDNVYMAVESHGAPDSSVMTPEYTGKMIEALNARVMDTDDTHKGAPTRTGGEGGDKTHNDRSSNDDNNGFWPFSW